MWSTYNKDGRDKVLALPRTTFCICYFLHEQKKSGQLLFCPCFLSSTQFSERMKFLLTSSHPLVWTLTIGSDRRLRRVSCLTVISDEWGRKGLCRSRLTWQVRPCFWEFARWAWLPLYVVEWAISLCMVRWHQFSLLRWHRFSLLCMGRA